MEKGFPWLRQGRWRHKYAVLKDEDAAQPASAWTRKHFLLLAVMVVALLAVASIASGLVMQQENQIC